MNPTIFDFAIFGRELHIYSYGLCLGLSLVIGFHLSAHFAAASGMAIDRLKRALFLVVLSALFFSRVAFFLAHPQSWQGLGGFFAVWDGGLVAYGGIVGGILTAYAIFPRYQLDFWGFADDAAPSLAFGLMLTRVGCLLNGCDFGSVTNAPWALSFPRGSPAWDEHLARGLIDAGAAQSLPVHPTQIYESLCGLVLLVALLWVRRRSVASGGMPRVRGRSLLLFLGAYAVFRFFVEFLRDDPQRGFWGSGALRLSTSQYVAAATLVAAAWIALRPPRSARNAEAADR